MIRAELRRVARGLSIMARVLGWQFVAAILVTIGLLLWALLHFHGLLAGVLGLVALLIAVRAHDLGEDLPAADPQAPAHDEEAAPTSFEQEQRERAAARAQVAFLRQRHGVALGPAHDPREL